MTEVVKREVGEHVSLTLGFDPSLTKDLGDGVFETTVTTSSDDRHNESIVTSGISTTNYEKNPVVLYGHDYQGLPIGKSLKLTTTAKKMKSRFQLAVEEYPFAATVAAMIKGGYLSAVSIGGIVRKWSDDYRTIEELEMVEFSIVPVPANPEALISSRSLENIVGKSIEEIEKEYHQFVQKNVVDKFAEMPDDEIIQAVKTLEGLVAVLKESAKPQSSEGKVADPEVKRIKRIRLMETAKAANRESERVIRLVKLKP